MRSRDKIEVRTERMYGGKLWLKVKHKRDDGSNVPSFEDWFIQLIALVYCEQDKYPDLPWPAHRKITEFFTDAIEVAATLAEVKRRSPESYQDEYERAWRELAAKYRLPIRD